MRYQNRVSELQQNLHKDEVIVISKESDLQYFAGFSNLVPGLREAFLIISHDQLFLLYSPLSPYRNLENCFCLMGVSEKLLDNLIYIQKQVNFKTAYLDYAYLSTEEYFVFQKLVGCELKKLDRNLITSMRKVKDDNEIDLIKQACQLSQKVMAELLASLRVGVSEIDLARTLEIRLREFGADSVAFPTIVAFGDHSALAHHQPCEAKLDRETAVMIDMGIKLQHYHSDITRVIWFGDQPDPEFLKIKQVVDEAYHNTLAKLQKASATNSTIKALDLDKIARDLITKHGYGQYFTHTTGHGLGLDIHEAPSISFMDSSLLTDQMIFTLEPGIYLPNKFGYRYENTILLQKNNISELTNPL